ncbi:protein YciE [Enterobacter cloacae]|nr:protein YciE [Enterobacter cloacae]
MNHVEHYHDWLRDAHAMEKQAESMLESMASRIELMFAPVLSSTLMRQNGKSHCWRKSSIVMIFLVRF